MAPAQPSCRACETGVARGTRVCPTCEYDVGRHDRARRWLGGVGTALALTGILAPVGLPLLWRAHLHRLAADGTVARRDETPLGAHLRDVFRKFLTLERGQDTPADFYRGSRRRVPEPGDIGSP